MSSPQPVQTPPVGSPPFALTPDQSAAVGAEAGAANPLQAIGRFFGSLGVLSGWLGNPLRIVKLFAGILLVNIALLVTFLPGVTAAIGGLVAGPEGAIAGYGVGRSAQRGGTGYTRESLRIYRGSQRRQRSVARRSSTSAPQRGSQRPTTIRAPGPPPREEKTPPTSPSAREGEIGRYNRQTKRRTPTRTETVARSGKI